MECKGQMWVLKGQTHLKLAVGVVAAVLPHREARKLHQSSLRRQGFTVSGAIIAHQPCKTCSLAQVDKHAHLMMCGNFAPQHCWSQRHRR